MATLVLGAVGSAIGGAFGGAILGFSGAAIGGFIGSTIGSVVDNWIVSSLAPAQRIEGARLDSLRITSSTEGAVIPRLFGRMRIGGNIIWATDFREEVNTTSQGGGKGSGPKVTTTEYIYFASFAVALCEGEITGIGRVWADGKAMDMTGVTWRWYPGDEVQGPDPFISAKMGAANTPAFRGTAYVVFEELNLSAFGNRLPQISFEVFRPLADPDTAEGLVKAVTMIPASGEFTYATSPVKKTTGTGGATVAENLNAITDTADIVVALDRLQSLAPAMESVSLVVAWFGDDLRAGNCKVRPGVEVDTKTTTPSAWVVNGVARADAFLISRDAEDRPVYGGTPADFAVVQAIQEMKARGLRVTFYPFLLLDVPPGNTKPNPYSANAAASGQPTFPWRGRITCSPAAGFAGSVDKTATAATQVAAMIGTATPANFSVSGTTVSWTGPVGEWGLRRMILHYAHLCRAAGDVDAFLIGSEMPGLTTIRSGASTYPGVTAFKSLAADVRAILGAGPKIGYAADWSEYFGHHPADGSGDVYFHLDPLWSDTNINFIGIDNYMPLVDLYSSTMESVTDITLLGGANALAVETGAGQWEIVQAGAAELIAPGRYRLTRLLRGQRGTESAIASSVPIGARVVVLDTAVSPLPIAEADLGLPWNWRIGRASKPVSDETFVATTFTPEGAGLRPFSVAHVEQPWRTARSPGDLTIRWTRRSRSLAADTWGVGDVPLAEDNETYEVDILDGATVTRTLQVATTSALYSAAQQTADWGAPIGPGQSLVIRIYQLSALSGRGAARSVTLSF
jgi:hypothetical protein